jgi:streptomycin 6-kinase
VIELPDLVRQRVESSGAEAQRWLADLPDLVDSLAARWDLALGGAMAGGTGAYVVAATRGDGRACVLKISLPLDWDGDAFAQSVLVHELAAGRGCVELLEHDVAAKAMLLEQLGPNLHDLDRSVPEVLDTVAATLHEFWRPIPMECGLPTGAAKAAWLAGYVVEAWEALGQPCPRAVVDRALRYCGTRADAFDPASAVLVHGDAHGWNTLDAGGGSYKFVDPEGMVSDRAHDLAVPMREYNEPLLAGDTPALVRARAERLAGRCAVDPEAVWEWGFVERVSTGLAGLQHFAGDEGLAFLAVAERCL